MFRPAFDIAQLTVAERLELIDRLWASLRMRPEALPLSEAERALVEARRAEHRQDPGSTIPWEAVRTELLADQDADERVSGESQAQVGQRGA